MPQKINCNLQIAGGSVSMRLRVKTPRGFVIGFFCILPSEHYEILVVKTEGKTSCFSQDEGENSYSEICPEHSV